jgi:adenine deaminase
MALAVNRLIEMQGGAVICADGEILAELPLPIGGMISDEPLDIVSQKAMELQQKATELGVILTDAHLTLTTLTSIAIPFIRICESGLMEIRENKLVGNLPSKSVQAEY